MPRSKTTDFAGLTLVLQESGEDTIYPEMALEFSRSGLLRVQELGPDWNPLGPLSEVSLESLGSVPDWVVLRCDGDLPNTLVLDLISRLREKGARRLQLAALPIGAFGPGQTLKLKGLRDYFIDGRPPVLFAFNLSESYEWAPPLEALGDGSCLTERLMNRLPRETEPYGRPGKDAELLSWEEHNYESLFLLLERAARLGAEEVTLWRAVYSPMVLFGRREYDRTREPSVP